MLPAGLQKQVELAFEVRAYLKPPRGGNFLIRAISGEDGSWRTEEDFYVEQQRLLARILQVQPYHLVKLGAAASIDLPESGDSRTGFEQTAAVPHVICFHFVR